ncbi:MAG TPA: NADH-quinone oxidoreductase subunit L [Candidatus Acidoferrales bacterium]|jgi:NADH-quinone oxidoreductase subunit L|nr:NADH-quinone oxidoreductase subunit L [Candidatus Acidoferrales bacterium]
MTLEYISLVWWVLFLPLLSAAFITLFTLRRKNLSSLISIGAVVTGFIMTVLFIHANGFQVNVETTTSWLNIGGLQVDIGLKLDALSLMMLLIVTGVGGAIHIYSYAYMDEDPSKARFFACLSLFTFSMLGIVLANNFVMMFIFWELVGVSSYLLIGFWYEKPSAGDAAKKAFIVNRLGDFGFLAGILMFWGFAGTLNFDGLSDLLGSSIAQPHSTHLDHATLVNGHVGVASINLTLAALLIFCGAMGKSAQFPLHVWLPDAMEGPTPVSALIHAATMVAAGVYMLCRTLFLYNADALHVIAYIGGFTALLAALIAVQQNDIKRIIAYSTLSQLGYMVMAVGLNGPTPAMFHLTTHAFFKALLFLAAGSVIMGMHHKQDIWQMGNLRKKMPLTFVTFLIGALALSGLWPLSGFFSKDSILGQAYGQHNYLLFGIGVFIAGLTTFYTFRLFFVVFFGKEKSEAASHAHESNWIITGPLVVLAIMSVIGGLIGIEGIYHHNFPIVGEESTGFMAALTEPFRAAPVAAGLGLLAFAIGLVAAWALYAKAETDPLPAKLGGLATAMKNKFYFDEIYEATFIRAHDALAAVADWVDRWLVEWAAIGIIRGGTNLSGRMLRNVQTGNLQTYAFLFVLGVSLLLYFVLRK